MGRNVIGGKNYKKTKHATEAIPYQERLDDQLWARIIRVLGNRNTLAYCNDNKIRLCHIRGGLRKDTWISAGDIVLISIRDFRTEEEKDTIIAANKEKYEKADILYKYDRDYHSKLRKEKEINTKLFLQLETASEENLALIKQNKMQTVGEEETDIFGDDDDDDDDVNIDAI